MLRERMRGITIPDKVALERKAHSKKTIRSSLCSKGFLFSRDDQCHIEFVDANFGIFVDIPKQRSIKVNNRFQATAAALSLGQKKVLPFAGKHPMFNLVYRLFACQNVWHLWKHFVSNSDLFLNLFLVNAEEVHAVDFNHLNFVE